MRLLRAPGERAALLQRVAEQVGTLSVLDLCCGLGDLQPLLKSTAYQGIDLNPAFIEPLRQRGVRVQEGDILNLNWPAAECLVMVDSLYHFIDRQEALLKKIQAHPARKIILAEPIHNVMNNLPSGLIPLANWTTRVLGKDYPKRFTTESFQKLMRDWGFNLLSSSGHNALAIKECR